MFKSQIAARDVVSSLKRHLLVDGFEVILDLEKSHGSWMVDARDGREYVDFFTGVASMPIGLNHPKMTTPAMIEKLGRLALNKPTNSDLYCEEYAEFVDTFFRVAVPPYFKYSFFVEGGAVGVENAIKAAFDWKVRKNFARGYTPEKGFPDGRGHRVLHFKEAFHGRTGYALSLTDSPDPNKTAWFPKWEWPRITNPKCSFPLSGENLARVQTLEAQAVREIEAALEKYKDDIACLIVEPIQGEGGDNQFRPEFFQTLSRLSKQHEFLLIMDEVQTGIGLTGKMWCHQHYGIEPDLMTFGKKMQVCGFVAGPRLDEVKDNVFHVPSRINSTWGGSLIDMVRCQLYLEIIEEENLLENARTEGAWLEGQVTALEQEFPGVIENGRGIGLFRAFDLNEKLDRAALLREAVNAGLLILPCGKRSVRFRPALNISRAELAEGLTRLRKAIQAAFLTAGAKA